MHGGELAFIKLIKYFGRPRHRWQDNIKMAVKETGCEDVNLTEVILNRGQ
jgi:hypothetical protein